MKKLFIELTAAMLTGAALAQDATMRRFLSAARSAGASALPERISDFTV